MCGEAQVTPASSYGPALRAEVLALSPAGRPRRPGLGSTPSLDLHCEVGGWPGANPCTELGFLRKDPSVSDAPFPFLLLGILTQLPPAATFGASPVRPGPRLLEVRYVCHQGGARGPGELRLGSVMPPSFLPGPQV